MKTVKEICQQTSVSSISTSQLENHKEFSIETADDIKGRDEGGRTTVTADDSSRPTTRQMNDKNGSSRPLTVRPTLARRREGESRCDTI
jgi:hypothetical protein